jgi:hypothetical protein
LESCMMLPWLASRVGSVSTSHAHGGALSRALSVVDVDRAVVAVKV